jgi:hypothetical protein
LANANLIANNTIIEGAAAFANATANNSGTVYITANGEVQINNDADANGTSSGALSVLFGGMTVSKNLSVSNGNLQLVAGNANIGGAINVLGNTLIQSTETVTGSGNQIFSGALQVAGDAGIGNTLYIGGILSVGNIINRTGNTIVANTPNSATVIGYIPYIVTGSGGNITATTNGNNISSLTIVSNGSGYGSSVSLVLTPPNLGNGVQATATCTEVNGVITTTTITNSGSGYTSAPQVIINDGLGTTYYVALYS